MNTTEVIITLARKLGISQVAARKLIHERLGGFSQTLVNENRVDLPGFGKLEIQQTKDRYQYIPGKKCQYLIPSHKRTTFKMSNLFKARLRRIGPQ